MKCPNCEKDVEPKPDSKGKGSSWSCKKSAGGCGSFGVLKHGKDKIEAAKDQPAVVSEPAARAPAPVVDPAPASVTGSTGDVATGGGTFTEPKRKSFFERSNFGFGE